MTVYKKPTKRQLRKHDHRTREGKLFSIRLGLETEIREITTEFWQRKAHLESLIKLLPKS